MRKSNMSEHTQPVFGPKVYAVILIALLVGTALTVWASYIDLGFWNPIVALAIATTKASLVLLYFMHVRHSTKLTKLAIAGCLFLFLTLVSMTLTDYVSRAWGSW